MAVNNLAFLPFQGESPVDNFLSAYAKGQQLQTNRQNQERQQVVNQREDQTFAQDQKTKSIDQLGAVLDGVQDGDEAGFERAKGWAVQNGLLDPNEAQRYTVQQLPQIRALSQQARQLAAQRAASTMAQQKFDLDRRSTEANIRQSDAAASASRASAARGGGGAGMRAPSGYTWGPDGMSLVPIPGGPADQSTKPLNEGQSNARGFANRIQSANEILNGADAASALGDSVTQGFAAIPLAGNYLAGQNYQQADQAVRDFINAQLRRESGAAIGTSEFDNAYKQYIPRPGDGPKVLEQKKRARELALENMLLASGPGGMRAPAASAAPPPTVPRTGAAQPAAARPTATGPNGQKLVLSEDGTQWVPAQ